MTAHTHPESRVADFAALTTALAPGELFALDLSKPPQYGAHRQGGCNEINRITDPKLGDCLEFVTDDTDQTLPGTNSPPLGGCYAVHRAGNGVACDLISGVRAPLGVKTYVRFKVAIPSSQPGLPGGFPASMAGKWLTVHESYGPPFAGAPVTAMSVATDPATGKLSWVYGPGSKACSFWTPLVFDQWFDFTVAVVPSTDPKAGSAEVTCNGQALRSKAGNALEQYATMIASDSGGQGFPLVAIDNYRSKNFGGPVRILFADFRIGSTLAGVSAGSPPPPPPPPSPGTPPPPPPVTPPPVVPPVTPPAGTVSLSTAEAAALGRYIRAHGAPANIADAALIAAIASRLPARH